VFTRIPINSKTIANLLLKRAVKRGGFFKPLSIEGASIQVQRVQHTLFGKCAQLRVYKPSV